jgi:hypothetical protein
MADAPDHLPALARALRRAARAASPGTLDDDPDLRAAAAHVACRRGDDGELELLCAGDTVPDVAHTAAPIHPRPTAVVESTVEEAEERLDAGDEPFVFFRSDGRGRVLYRRRDGHYGLILAA